MVAMAVPKGLRGVFEAMYDELVAMMAGVTDVLTVKIILLLSPSKSNRVRVQRSCVAALEEGL